MGDFPLINAYKYNWKVEAKLKEYPDPFDIELFNSWDQKKDCKIGHFGYNFYIRTPYGIKAKQYKNWSSFTSAIKRVLKNNNLTLEYIKAHIGIGSYKMIYV
jgi:hypothetical protein